MTTNLSDRSLNLEQKEAKPGQSSVSDRFFHHASTSPNSAAIEYQQLTISYGELALTVKKITDILPSPENIKPVVAIFGDVGPGYIASVVAAMHKGLVVLPIDNRTPIHRQSLMLQLANVSLVICCDNNFFNELKIKNLPVIALSELGEIKSVPQITWQPSKTSTLDFHATYIFFTSGTTGNPKPVIGSRRSLDHFILWQRRQFNVSKKDRVAQLTNLSFDPCLREIFVSLTSGACLLLPTQNCKKNVNQLLEFVAHKKATILHMVPTVAKFWIRSIEEQDSLGNQYDQLNRVRLTFFAGEPLAAAVVTLWGKFVPNSTIVNLYGPTETTLAKFFWEIPLDANLPDTLSLPVGEAIPNTSAIIVGPHGDRVAPGESGEIYIDTAYPSCGYLISDANSSHSATFVEYVKGDKADIYPQWGKKLYRTGDIGCIDDSGKLVIQGRVGEQIKISGVRINPLEIVEAVKKYPPIIDCIVDLWKNNIAVWYLLKSGESISISPLRMHLLQYIIPAVLPKHFFCISDIPMTANGKIDKEALYNIAIAKKAEKNRPLVNSEIQLAKVWNQVLGINPNQACDDFFSLGGDSLKALELSRLVSQKFKSHLQIEDIFQYSELESMSELIRSMKSDEKQLLAGERNVDVEHNDDQVSNILSLSPQQLDFKTVCMTTTDASWCCLSRLVPIPYLVNVSLIRDVWYQLVKEHDSLRLCFPKLFTDMTQELLNKERCKSNHIPIQEFDSSDCTPEDAGNTLIKIRAEGSKTLFDLHQWPLFKLALVKMPNGTCIHVVWMHHLIIDGYSFNLLIKQLTERLLNKRKADEYASSSYREYIDWSTIKRSESFNQDQQYWHRLLTGATAFYLPEQANGESFSDGARGCFYVHRIHSTLVERINMNARSTGVTPFIIFLGAFLSALSKLSGKRDLLVNIPAQVRPHVQWHHTVGMFFSQVLVRVKLDDIEAGINWPNELSMQVRNGQRHYGFEFYQRLNILTECSTDAMHYPITTALFNVNQIEWAESSGQYIVEGHQDLGRSLRFQLQGELQVIGNSMYMSYLYRRGVLPEPHLIEDFATQVCQCSEFLCSNLEQS